MPIHTFQCDDGHTFEALVRPDGADTPASCTALRLIIGEGVTAHGACGKPVRRVMSAPASKFPGADAWRRR